MAWKYLYFNYDGPSIGGRHLGLRLFAVCRRGRRRRRRRERRRLLQLCGRTQGKSIVCIDLKLIGYVYKDNISDVSEHERIMTLIG